jgi:hypothetical protein
MDGDKAVGALALRRIGDALQRDYGIQTRLPSRLNSLVGHFASITREEDYRDRAAEALRLAQHVPSSSDKGRLLKLAEGWVELADKAHDDIRRPRRPTILHSLVQKKLGDLPN